MKVENEKGIGGLGGTEKRSKVAVLALDRDDGEEVTAKRYSQS